MVINRRKRPGQNDYPFLHWLQGWAERIESYLNDPEAEHGPDDWMIYRPDRLADRELMQLSTQHPEAVRYVRELVRECDELADALRTDEGAAVGLSDCMDVLADRIKTLVGMAEHVATQNTGGVEASGKAAAKKHDRKDEPTKKEIAVVEKVLAEMTAQDPKQDAVAAEVRNRGHKISNAKVGKALRQLKQRG